MNRAILKSLHPASYDEPKDYYPEPVKIELVAEIGPEGEGTNSFYFTVVTTKYIKSIAPTWHCPPKGYLIMNSFSWHEAEAIINKLLNHQPEGSWEEKAGFLSEYMNWEYENYQD